MKNTWYKTCLSAALVAGIVGLGVSGCDLKNRGVESHHEKPAATATQAPAQDKTTEAASGKKSETAETTATSNPAPSPERTENPKKTRSKNGKSDAPAKKSKVHYKNCDEVKEAGAAPLYEGDPGYSSKLDRDGDGVACEK